MSLLKQIEETRAFIASKVAMNDPVGVVLGTGLGGFAEEMEIDLELNYADIPHFPHSTVEGHAGKLVVGKIGPRQVLAMKGRFHFYEGYTMQQVVYPIRVMAALGVKSLVLSNASGGMNPDFNVGDIMLIRDHINLFPTNPLIGQNETKLGPRFPDMSEAYYKPYLKLMKDAANSIDLNVHEGVYVGLSGPCFETPAEYRYLRIIGADAVGMSTVPENIAAVHMGMRVAALSVITDLGVEGIVEKVSHEEVQRAASEAGPRMTKIVKSLITNI